MPSTAKHLASSKIINLKKVISALSEMLRYALHDVLYSR